MLDAEVEAKIAQRNAARQRNDFAEADRIRDELRALPERIELQDFSFGTRWYRTMLSEEEKSAILARYDRCGKQP